MDITSFRLALKKVQDNDQKNAVLRRNAAHPIARHKVQSTRRAGVRLPPGARRCRAKFLRHFIKGFRDETYIDWERNYKWSATKDGPKRLMRRHFESS